jgi:Ca-activated chloride channel homolog
MNVLSDGYHTDWNVQFPRDIRVEGATYLVDSVEEAGSGGFYRAVGTIKRVLKPGETVTSSGSGSRPRSGKKTASAAPATAADLETTTVVDGVLVQCVKEGSKLRARVVSDGYDPDYNIRFPRSIRELGVLYVVEEVEEAAGGGSYVAYGKIKRLVQAP